MIPMAIEEGLRFETPLTMVMRTTTEEVEIGGKAIPAEAQIDMCMGSANRDESRWTDPNTFDICRPRQSHIAFAGGIHMCLGMHLARLETRVMLNSLFDRVDASGVRARRRDRRGIQDRRAHLPVAEQASGHVHPRRMRSRAAILHDVGGPWSVEEFELDPPKTGEVLVADGGGRVVPLRRPHPQRRHVGAQ